MLPSKLSEYLNNILSFINYKNIFDRLLTKFLFEYVVWMVKNVPKKLNLKSLKNYQFRKNYHKNKNGTNF